MNIIKNCLLVAMANLAFCFFSSAADQRPRIVFVTGDHEYSSELTMPALAKELKEIYGMETTVLYAEPDYASERNIPGLEALKTADLVVFFLRWRHLPDDQLKRIQDYLDSGKPVMGFRTTSHAFSYPKGHRSEGWNAFGETVFGTPPGWGTPGYTHYGHTSSTDVSINSAQADHPILKGVPQSFHVRSWLYQVGPSHPPPEATPLLFGRPVNPDKKAAVENPVAWTYQTPAGGRAFYTSMGHPDDFKVEAFQRLLLNAVFWSLGEAVPDDWAGQININIAYDQHRKPPKKEEKKEEKKKEEKHHDTAGVKPDDKKAAAEKPEKK